MKKYGKLIAMLLTFTLMISLGACSGGTANSPAEKTVSESTATENIVTGNPASQQSEETSENSTPSKVSYTLPLFDQTAEVSIFYGLRTGQGGLSFPSHGDAKNKYWQYLCKNLNVDIKWTEPGQSVISEQFNLMIASGDMTDIMCENMVNMDGSAYTGGYDKAMDDGVYVDLAPYLAEYAPNYNYYVNCDPENRKVIETDEGHIGAFLTVSSETAVTNLGNAVNAAYFNATGLEMPDTIDGWKKVFAAMHDNGVKYALDVQGDGTMMGGAIGAAVGTNVSAKFLIDKKSGELVFDATTDEARQYIELFREFYKDGYIDHDFINNTDPENKKFFTGEVATKTAMGKQLAAFSETYGIDLIACPVICRDGYESGQVALGTSVSNVSAGGGMAISTSCKDLETAMRLMDWFYSDEGAQISNYGWVEGETYNVVDGEKYINDFYQAKDENNVANRGLYTTDQDFGLIFPNLSTDVAPDVQKAASEMWTPDADYPAAIYMSLPTAVRLTAAESEDLSSSIADLETYIETTVMRWYCLEDELNDTTWSEYVSTCESMKLDNIRSVYQAAYEKYLAK